MIVIYEENEYLKDGNMENIVGYFFILIIGENF